MIFADRDKKVHSHGLNGNGPRHEKKFRTATPPKGATGGGSNRHYKEGLQSYAQEGGNNGDGHHEEKLQRGIRKRSSFLEAAIPDYGHVLSQINGTHTNKTRDLYDQSIAIRSKAPTGAVQDLPDANKAFAGHNIPWAQFAKRFIDQVPGLIAPNGQLVIAGKAESNSGKWGDLRWYVVSMDSVEDGTIAADFKNGFQVMRTKELPGGKKVKYWDTCEVDYQFGEVVECGRMPSGRTVRSYAVDEHGNATPKIQEIEKDSDGKPIVDSDGNFKMKAVVAEGDVQLQPGYLTKQVTMAAPLPLFGGDRAIHYAKNAYGHYLNEAEKVLVWDKQENRLAQIENPEIDPKTGLFPTDPEKNYFYNNKRYTAIGFRRIEYYTKQYVIDNVEAEFGSSKTKEQINEIVNARYKKEFDGRNIQSLTFKRDPAHPEKGTYAILTGNPGEKGLEVEYELQLHRPGVEFDDKTKKPVRVNVSKTYGKEFEPAFGADDIWNGIQEKGRDPREIWVEPSEEGFWRGPKYRGELSGNSQEVFTFDAESITSEHADASKIAYSRRERINGLKEFPNDPKSTTYLRGLVQLPYDIGGFKKGEKVFVSVEPDYVKPGNNEVVWINRVDFRKDEKGVDKDTWRLRGFWSRPKNFTEVIVRDSNGNEMPYHAQGRGQETGGGQNGGPSALMHGMELYGYVVSKTGAELVRKYVRRGKNHKSDDPDIYDKAFLPGGRHGDSFNCPTFMNYSEMAHQFQQLLGWNTDDWMTVRVIMASCFANSLFCEAWERIQNGVLESTGLRYWGMKLGLLSDKDSLGNSLEHKFSIHHGTTTGVLGAVTAAGAAAALGAGLGTIALGGLAAAVALSAASSLYYYSEVYDKSSRRRKLCNQEEIQKNPVEITDDDDPKNRYVARGYRVERPADMHAGLETHKGIFEGLKNDLKWGYQNAAAHYFLYSNGWESNLNSTLGRDKGNVAVMGIFSSAMAAVTAGVAWDLGGLAVVASTATGVAVGSLTVGAVAITTAAALATCALGAKALWTLGKHTLNRDGEDLARYYAEQQSEFVRNGYRKFFKDGRNYNNRFA